MRLLDSLMARLRLLRPRAAETRMEEEMRFHLEMEADRLVREDGLAPAEARRRARLSFGGADRYREEMRDGRGLAWLSGFSLDLKLGLRMLVKYPGLTVVSALAMGFAIFVGAVSFEFLTQLFNPSLPLPDGDRVVAIETWDVEAGRREAQLLHDLVLWQRELETVDDVGAFTTTGVNLITADGGAGRPLSMAEMSASGFRAAGVSPLFGRTLLDADEAPSAAPVVVLGFAVWQSRFGGDRDVVGQTVRLGRRLATVVGVMPEGFAFPIAHELWVPLRLNPLHYGPGEGPSLSAFGRLAPGASLADARSELMALGDALAAEHPATHGRLQPRIGRYARSHLPFAGSSELDIGRIAGLLRASLNVPLVLFLILICGNVSLLVFARAATRESEITVRTVLGASRRRIVGQLFAEALAIGAVAAVVGLAAARVGVELALWLVQSEVMEGESLPFWFQPRLSLSTYAYAALLTLIGAAIAGMIPAFKVTRGLADRLRQTSAGGGGFRFGGLWTVVVVSQIAITIPFPIIVYAVHAEAAAIRAVDVGIDEDRYITTQLQVDQAAMLADAPDTSTAAIRQQLQRTVQELERRLEADPAVAGVTFANRLPRMYHPYRLIEMEGGPVAPLDPRWPGYRISTASVSPDYFEVLGVPLRAGRSFTAADAASEAAPVIVNESFVERVMGGRSPIGYRFRYAFFGENGPVDAAAEPWYEIIGVVRDLGMSYGEWDPKEAGIYHPRVPGSVLPVHVAVHLRDARGDVAQRIRPIAASVDPMLRVHEVTRLDEVNEAELQFYKLWFWVSIAGSGVALLLSLAGIYAVMSFTVSQRTREIGIRVALGADRFRVIRAIFRQPLRQVGLGILVGGTVLTVLLFSGDQLPSVKLLAVFAAYLTVMMLVCMLAWIVPTRRALAVEPQEALRWE